MVALLDTGCAPHYWLTGVVRTDVKLDGHAIGYTGADSNPELNGDLVGPFDGEIDRVAGHGTFLAGLVHQACPDADILAWRGVPSDGPLVESDWITSLAQIAELARRHRAGEKGGHPIDVLSLSMGYYHENPADDLLDPILLAIIDELSRNGTLVVCSAGNDATDRPSYPAAFAPWNNGGGPRKASKDTLPVVSVGAMNPNRTDALFTNAGPWVRAYAPGASVMSTVPPFVGGREPLARMSVDGRVRESIDLDDFTSGFAVWSGTSFAAPVMAGALAKAMAVELAREKHSESSKTAVRRGWAAVEACTPIRP